MRFLLGVRVRVKEKHNNCSTCFLRESEWSVGTAAMMLALTRTVRAEEDIKRILSEKGFKLAVTEIGGKSFGEFQDKATRSILGACLNIGIISKTPYQAHALLHAAEEAKRGVLINVSSSTSIAIKVAIVRDKQWIAVAMFGESAIHPLTNHERAGLGIMHLSDV